MGNVPELKLDALKFLEDKHSEFQYMVLVVTRPREEDWFKSRKHDGLPSEPEIKACLLGSQLLAHGNLCPECAHEIHVVRVRCMLECRPGWKSAR